MNIVARKTLDYENTLENDTQKRQFYHFDAATMLCFWSEKSGRY